MNCYGRRERTSAVNRLAVVVKAHDFLWFETRLSGVEFLRIYVRIGV
jgi:hypothetical protein